ncbi:MAG TPA: RimK family protein [Opitutales bacterium]|nr:RimK family protein [Opitutales bacterium]
MTPYLLVVDNPDRWPLAVPGVTVVGARTYLTDHQYCQPRAFKVINMCRSYRYQSVGYYVSLLGEARGHRPIPATATIQDLKTLSIIRSVSEDLDEQVQRSLAHLQGSTFTLSIYFARNMAKRYDRLSRELFSLFPAPLLRAYFVKNEDGWAIQNISPIPTSEVPESHRPSIVEFAKQYFEETPHARRRKNARFSLAMLVDPGSTTAPSNEKALKCFEKAAEELDMSIHRITKDDYDQLLEYDGLFIRATTAVNDFTYRFSRRAHTEGMVVIDDPDSILKCTNKVFLAELLDRHKILTPKTVVLHRDNVDETLAKLGLPIILKQPDSSFSQGVVKANTKEEFHKKVDELLEKSDLLIAQEFLFTDFDWRIGIIDGQPLFACKYYMAPAHWQIYNHDKTGDDSLGNCDTLAVELAPRKVVRTALKVAELIGDGLYGVDLKVANDEVHVIEINDNPSVDAGIEDEVLRKQLYHRIMHTFLTRLERQRLYRA